MRTAITAALGLLLAFVAFNPAAARDPTSAEKVALETAVEKFTAAMDAGDHSAMADATPPSILQHIAESAGIEVEALRDILISQMETMLAGSSIVEYSIDAGEGAVFRELGDGTPYALLPTETVIMSQGTKVTSRSQSLALLDEDNWYLLRVSDPQQVAILRQVYPAFADVKFPESSTAIE